MSEGLRLPVQYKFTYLTNTGRDTIYVSPFFDLSFNKGGWILFYSIP